MCSALEPKISGQIMELHHGKHHATYVAGINAAGKELEQVLLPWP
jgi:Fe-Mn family superoxide dismutase